MFAHINDPDINTPMTTGPPPPVPGMTATRPAPARETGRGSGMSAMPMPQFDAVRIGGRQHPAQHNTQKRLICFCF